NPSGGVQLAGGVLTPGGNNALAGVTGPITVTANSTLKPVQTAAVAGLSEFHRNGADLAGDVGTAGATASGVKDGIPGIDSVYPNTAAKPYGDNNAFIYTGQIVNTTAGNIGVTF